MIQHTKPPFEFDGDRIISSPNRGNVWNQIAEIGYHGCRLSKEDKANAEFIVRACNCHDELVAALESLTIDGTLGDVLYIVNIIKKARGVR